MTINLSTQPTVAPMHLATRLAAAGLLFGVLLSPALWGLADAGGFPALPLAGDAYARAGSGWLGAGVLVSAAAVLVAPGRKVLLALCLLWLALGCSLDVMRLQPWVWCYALFLVVGLWERELTVAVWILAGIYFWSGLYKLSPYFVEGNFSWFCEAFDATRSFAGNRFLGYLIPTLEMLAGLGLVWKKSARAAAGALLLMHALIIVFLLKLGWNTVVIPWNLTLGTLLWQLFIRQETTAWPFPSRPGSRLVLALVWIAPALSPLGLWPFTLSWQLYSNNQPEATLEVPHYEQLPPGEWQQIRQKYALDGGDKMLLEDWSYGALKAPIFVSDRSFEQTARYLCSKLGTAAGPCSLLILRVSPWDSAAERWDTIYLTPRPRE